MRDEPEKAKLRRNAIPHEEPADPQPERDGTTALRKPDDHVPDAEQKYALIAAVLKAHRYAQLDKGAKFIVRRFLQFDDDDKPGTIDTPDYPLAGRSGDQFYGERESYVTTTPEIYQPQTRQQIQTAGKVRAAA